MGNRRPRYNAKARASSHISMAQAERQEAQTVKMSAKKRKKLEKFVEKQLKKEEKVKLMDKLSQQKFHHELLLSSKNMSRGKLTMKEELRRALQEHRLGIPASNPDIPLFIEKDAVDVDDEETATTEGTHAESQDATATTSTTTNHELSDDPEDQDSDAASTSSQESDETNAIAPKMVVWDGYKTVDAAEEPVPEAPQPQTQKPALGSALKKPALGSALKKPTIGSALKQSTTESTQPALGSALKKPTLGSALKRKADKVHAHSSSEDSDEDNHQSNEAPSTHWSIACAVNQPKKSTPPTQPSVKTPHIPTNVIKPSAKLQSTATEPKEKPFYVTLNRPEAIALSRQSLPITAHEQEIMETIYNNDVTVLCGETGSGKTTQLPQFLYEAGFSHKDHPKFPGMIAVTQPRRVAAVSMAKRVAEEMGLKMGKEIGYQIRYDKTVGLDTRIKFMTDGVLLRELSSATESGDDGNAKTNEKKTGDLLLSQYSAIIIDEAHERTVGTDVLIGWLSRIVKLRNSGKIRDVKPLKLIIMSATLRVEDFVENEALFPIATESTPQTKSQKKKSKKQKTKHAQPTITPIDEDNPNKIGEITTQTNGKPPVVKVDGRQYKVTIHYNKKTALTDYVDEAFKKVCKIHKRLPHGAILVFLTGQQEIQQLCRKLSAAFPGEGVEAKKNHFRVGSKNENEKMKPGTGLIGDEIDDVDMDVELNRGDAEVDHYEHGSETDSEEDEVQVLDGLDGEEEQNEPVENEDERTVAPLHVLPLYSLLPTAAQMRVFEEPPPGHRLCVVATNVAETSLTIPGVKYVVDAGRAKERLYDPATGIHRYQIAWTSKAGADQRAGRAGRVAPGHCYRLFSSAVFEDQFPSFSDPEILRTPLEGVVLQMKAMGIANVVNFPFPSQPDPVSLRSAEKLLCMLGAIDSSTKTLSITPLGRLMAKFPVAPRFAKMIVIAAQQEAQILPYMLAIVAGLSVGDPFVRDEDILGIVDSERKDDSETMTIDGQVIESEDMAKREARKKKRAAYFKMMAALTGPNPTSDLFRLLSVIGAYECELTKGKRAAESFCEQAFVRPKAMDEIHKLRLQLSSTVSTVLKDHPVFAKWKSRHTDLANQRMPPPPTSQQQGLILQTLLAAFPDQLARLDPDARVYGKNKNVPQYQLLTSPGHAQIHNTSALWGAAQHKYVLYLEIMGKEDDRSGNHLNPTVSNDNQDHQQQRLLLKNVSVIEEDWIAKVLGGSSICRYARMLTTPEPKYDFAADCVQCLVIPELSQRGWALPVIQIEMPSDKNLISAGFTGTTEKAKWFARALLEGKVFEGNLQKGNPNKNKTKTKSEESDLFKFLTPYITPPPATITKPQTGNLCSPKLLKLLSSLVASSVFTRQSLLDKWSRDPTFLRDPIVDLINIGAVNVKDTIKKHWPPYKWEGDVVRANTEFRSKLAQSSFEQARPTTMDVGSDYDSE